MWGICGAFYITDYYRALHTFTKAKIQQSLAATEKIQYLQGKIDVEKNQWNLIPI